MTLKEQAHRAWLDCKHHGEAGGVCEDCVAAAIFHAVAEEREACARVADDVCESGDDSANTAAYRIRKRGKQ